MKKELTTKQDVNLALDKSKSLINITSKLLSRKDSKEVVESLKTKLPTKIRIISDEQTRAIEFKDQIEAWIDKDTGLMWEIKTKENIKYTYVWSKEYFAITDRPEYLKDNVRDAFSYANKLNELNYAGFSDWRVPTKKELETLLVRGECNKFCVNT